MKTSAPSTMRRGLILSGRYIVKSKPFRVHSQRYQASAKDKLTGKRVTVLEYSPRITDEITAEMQESAKQVFLKTGRTLAALPEYPALLRTLDVFEENGTAYLVSEPVSGSILDSYLWQWRRDHVGFAEMLDMLRPVMEALAAVHEAGIVHGSPAPRFILASRDREHRKINCRLYFFLTAECQIAHLQNPEKVLSPDSRFFRCHDIEILLRILKNRCDWTGVPAEYRERLDGMLVRAKNLEYSSLREVLDELSENERVSPTPPPQHKIAKLILRIFAALIILVLILSILFFI